MLKDSELPLSDVLQAKALIACACTDPTGYHIRHNEHIIQLYIHIHIYLKYI